MPKTMTELLALFPNNASILDASAVVSCAIALELKPNADISVWKWERHKKRLEEMEGK